MSAIYCLICRTVVNLSGRQPQSGRGAPDESWFECPQCGKYGITDLAWQDITHRQINLALVSAWIRQRHDESGHVVSIGRADIDGLAALQFPTFKERMESYLLAAVKRSTLLQSPFEFVAPPLIATACCSSRTELEVIVQHLKSEGHLTPLMQGGTGPARAVLTPKGHMYVDELQTQHAASSQGFIAMWFSDDMEAARREGLEPGIRNAGYKAHRVDDTHHIDRIDDRIIAEIRRSKFVVADLTGHRGGLPIRLVPAQFRAL